MQKVHYKALNLLLHLCLNLMYLCLKLILVYAEKPFVIISNNINHTTYETLPFMP